MQDTHRGSGRAALYSILSMSTCCAVATLVLSSCGAGLPVQREAQQAGERVLAARYSIVCVIHGDGDYLYHDTSGNEHLADEEALAGAKKVAQENPTAEVFIFFRKPRRHLLFFFPVRDGEFYYYRNGRLSASELYWRDEERSPFDAELALYRRFRADNRRGKVNLFLYAGHEIPEFGGAGYDASYPERPFTVHDLAVEVKGFAGDSGKFDLMALSTCFGGTPYTVGELGAFTRYIVASPDNLHLSYFDLHSLECLDLGVHDGDVPLFAERFARQAFDRLTSDVQTAVTVAVYDVDQVQGYLQSVQQAYHRTLNAVKGETQSSMASIEHCDCADLPAYVLPTMNVGVKVFFRPARFGRSKQKQSHSGWECWKERALQSATSQATEQVQK